MLPVARLGSRLVQTSTLRGIRLPLLASAHFSSGPIGGPRVAIVGSGPAGFYTADRLLRRAGAASQAAPEADGSATSAALRIDILESLPVPFGLARHGVAPDHQAMKQCINRFDALLAEQREAAESATGQPQLRWFGNVTVGAGPPAPCGAPVPEGPPPPALSLAALRSAYDAVILAHGAQDGRDLGVPVVDVATGRPLHATSRGTAAHGAALERMLVNLLPARDFVCWYNGQTDHTECPVPALAAPAAAWLPVSASELAPGLTGVRVAELPAGAGARALVVGNGNVALDVARALLRGDRAFEKLDVPRAGVLEVLRRHAAAPGDRRIRHVEVIGRRGPAEVSFTISELRELVGAAIARHAGQAPDPEKFPLDAADPPGEEVVLVVPEKALVLQALDAAPAPARPRVRLLALLRQAVEAAVDPAEEPNVYARAGRTLTFRFFAAPTAILAQGVATPVEPEGPSADGCPASYYQVAGLRLGLSTVDPATGRATPRNTGTGLETQILLPASVVLTSVGFRVGALDDEAPIDTAAGANRLAHDGQGRVLPAGEPQPPADSSGSSSTALAPVYCAGWAKTGPVGVIASTMADAYATADVVWEDLAARGGTRVDTAPGFEGLPIDHSQAITAAQWALLDREERARGEAAGALRDKIPSRAEQLRLSRGGSASPE
ncbi:hypothetical protein H696_02838 [Fonticula alba]|uniref:FAD/NAD(P)-binding domain-containing protein n=1 Tax=Fonticula alba TaxID=691883 RepID=A0A058ZAP1_FONAL|nr:hypothetical protein H696_02838 [Fonticula alba]KCV70497.1 hypothetical protein H696_02838 [Fonticula alba]|eukprot:XP_009495013.1 hypothetical protein H696_02838 [Fonticula alba]